MLIRKGLQPTLEQKEKDQERIILHLDMDAFFAQVEEAANPLLRGKPVFVVGHSMTSGVILTANYEARKYGVKTGIPLREAKRLCPRAVLVPADCAKYADTSEQILSHLAAYTPLVEIFSIDEAFLDITDTCYDKGDSPPKWGQSPFCFWETPEAIARKIKAWVLENFNLTLSIGIAPNKLLAKLASDWNKPDGLFRISPENREALLKTLPIEKLCGIGHRLKTHLNGMGVFTAGELGRFSEHALFTRFGIIGPVLRRMGQGVDHSPVLPADHTDRVKSVGHSYTLTRATPDRKQVQQYLLWLSEKVGRRLRRRGYEGKTVHVTVRFSDFETVSKQKNLSCFLCSGKTIFEYAGKIFSEIDQPRRPVRLLGVSVSNLRPRDQEGWLWGDFEREGRLLDALDAVNDKYGEFTLRRALLAFPGDEKIASRALQLFGSGRH